MRPKLADGSRLDGSDVVDLWGKRHYVYRGLLCTNDVNHNAIACSDALAAIRLAGADPVWDAAVRLKNHQWNGQERTKDWVDIRNILVESLCIAVAQATEEEP